MNAPGDTIARSHTGTRRLITPWAYRHLRLCAGVRIAAAAILLAIAAFLFADGHAGWATLPLVFAAVHVAWAWWQMTIARSAVPRT